MFRATLRKELLLLFRNRWLCAALLAFAILVCVSLLQGVETYQRLATRQADRHAASRQDWIDQDTRSAHMATHHGTSVHKALSPFFAFDMGVDPHLGTSVKLESHHQQAMTEPLVEEIVDPLRFDVSSPALLLQLVFPLLIIFSTFSSVALERRQGTLQLALASGVRWRVWIGAKIACHLTLITAALGIPLAAPGIWLLLRSPSTRFAPGDLWVRFGLLSVTLLLYAGGWACLAAAVSARVRTSQTALVILLALWTIWCVVLPRVAVEIARQQAPLPLQEDLVSFSRTQVEFGEDANAARKIYDKLEKELLAEHGVENVKELPLNFGAAKMIALEKYTDQLYDAQAERLDDIYVHQDEVVSFASWGSPYLAMRNASSALAGADRHHHQAFYDAAEAYRRELVRIMNEFDMAKVKPTKVKAGPEVWGLVPDFRYTFPTWTTIARHVASPLTILSVWFLGTALAAFWSPRNL